MIRLRSQHQTEALFQDHVMERSQRRRVEESKARGEDERASFGSGPQLLIGPGASFGLTDELGV